MYFLFLFWEGAKKVQPLMQPSLQFNLPLFGQPPPPPPPPPPTRPLKIEKFLTFFEEI